MSEAAPGTPTTALRAKRLRLAFAAVPWSLAFLVLAQVALGFVDPVAAVATWQRGTAIAWWILVRLLVLVAVLLFLYPPFPASLRYGLARFRSRLQADRGKFLIAKGELRHVETAARHYEVGRAAMAIDSPREAAPHLVRALELEPSLHGARYQLAIAALRLADPRAAEVHLAYVVSKDEGHAFGDALLMLGRSRQLQLKHEAARADYERHERAHGGNCRSHFWLGQVRRALGDAAGAREAFEVAANPTAKQKRTAEENLFRARARVALWFLPRGGKS